MGSQAQREKSKGVVAFYCDPRDWEALKQLAAQDDRSASSYLRRLIKERLERDAKTKAT